MKRNRFQEMIPPTPADFHGSVVDALNRMEAAERRHRVSAARVGAYAAAAAALVLVVCLAVMMPKRPQREDVVTAPNVSEMVVRPTEEPEQVSMEIGAWQVADDGSLTLEWTMTATEAETLLICGKAKPVFENGVQLEGFETFSLDGISRDPDYLQIGKDWLGADNGTVIQCRGESVWRDKGMPVALAIHFDVYRPMMDPVVHSSLGDESFQNRPTWLVLESGAQPIDWHDGTHEFKTCFGSKLVFDILNGLLDDFESRKVTTPEETLERLQEVGALRTALLEGYDFAEHVKSFDFIVDLTPRSGEGADAIEE